jgi:3-hydroxybutyryl-CoA dehydrogenase
MAIEIRKVGVIGAGQMGCGIAQVCAAAGMDVAVNDVSIERINAGLATINGNMARLVARNQMDEAERKVALERIKPAASYAHLSDCDLIIEAATGKVRQRSCA